MALLTRQDQPELIGFAGDGLPTYGPYGFSELANPPSAHHALISPCQSRHQR